MPPTRITILDLSAYVGLLAVGAVTLNVLMGLLMAFRYSPHRSWPHHRFNYFRFHNWTGYFVLALSTLHPAILLLNKNPRFLIFEFCSALIVAIGLLRWRYSRKKASHLRQVSRQTIVSTELL